MKGMKDRNAKACRGFVWIKPMSDWDRTRGCLVFPMGVRKATNQGWERSWGGDWRLGHPRQLHVQGEPGMGPGANATHSPLLGRRGVRGSQADGSGSQKVTRWLFYDSGEKAISQEGCSPREGERWFPCSPLSLTETKTRLNTSAKIIYKNLPKWTSRWVGGRTWTLT